MKVSSLSLLLWYRLRGNLRQRMKELSGWRGLVSVCSIVLFTVALIYSLGDQLNASVVPQLTNDRLTLAGILPLGIILAVASTVLFGSGPALYFSQSEVNILWTAPVTRFWLVAYKLVSYSAGAIVTALLLVVLLPGNPGARVVRFIGIFLTLIFVQVCSTALRMAVSSIAHRNADPDSKFTRNAKPLLAVAVVFVFFLILALIQNSQPGRSLFSEVMSALSVLMLPFSKVSGLMLYVQFDLNFTIDCVVVCAMIALCTIAIVRLDRTQHEYMLDESTQASLRWTRALQTGMLSERRYVSNRSGRPAARLGGIGPIYWCRWLYALRSSGHLLLALVVVSGFVGVVAGTLTGKIPVIHLAAAVCFASIYFLPRVLVFDFRGVPQMMETLHGLPVSAVALCLAQVAVPVIWKTLLEMTFVTGMLVTSEQITVKLWLIALWFLPLINVLIVGVDNLLFLLHPNRLLPVGRLDFDFLGRTLFEFLCKSVILVSVMYFGFGTASWILKATQGNWILFIVVFLCVLLIACIAIVFCLAVAYTKVDVSKFDDL